MPENERTEKVELQSLAFAAATFQKDPRLIEVSIAAIQTERAVVAGTPQSRQATPAMILINKRYYHTDEIVDAITWLARHDAEQAQSKSAKKTKENLQ